MYIILYYSILIDAFTLDALANVLVGSRLDYCITLYYILLQRSIRLVDVLLP